MPIKAEGKKKKKKNFAFGTFQTTTAIPDHHHHKNNQLQTTMANYLASIYGTEQDKVNCSFYYKIGACRHGDKCSRKHVKPSYSQTILCKNLYQNPAFANTNNNNNNNNNNGGSYFSGNNANASNMSPEALRDHFNAFYEDFFCEAAKFGPLEEVIVCENNNDHLVGNVYARFKYEADAQKALDNFSTRWYDGRPVYCELSPVTDFKEACCRQHDSNECSRGGYCNFIHAKRPPRSLLESLELSQYKYLVEQGKADSSDSDDSVDLKRRR